MASILNFKSAGYIEQKSSFFDTVRIVLSYGILYHDRSTPRSIYGLQIFGYILTLCIERTGVKLI